MTSEAPDRGARWRAGLLALAVLLVLAAAFAARATIAAWLDAGGPRPATAVASDQETEARLARARAEREALERRLAGLKASNHDVAEACPPGWSPAPTAPPARDPGRAVATPAPATGSAPAAPAAPAAASSPASASPSTPRSAEATATVLARAALMEAVENATALVLVKGRDGVSMGSGFFISDSLLVTNGHVVEDLKGPGVSLVSRALGTMRRGTVMARAYAPGTRDVFDFALIRLDDGVAPGRLPLALRIGKLDDVVAAGYPGVVVRADESFKRLVAGDASSAPDLNFTTGAVQSIQRQGDSVEQIAHTAAIYRGNSGGPLVDKCGRVVGVNTFGLKTENAPGATTIDFAQGSSMLVKFLQRASQSLDADIRPCGS